MMKKAFTLIEILVAMSILVIVIGSTLAIFRASATSWQKGETRAKRYQRARFIFEIMSREIASIVPTSSAGPYCLGTKGTLYCISALIDTQGALTEVGYWLDADEKELMRSYDAAPDYDFSSFDEEEVLSEGVSFLEFSYSTGENWQATWDSRLEGAQSGALPKAIRVSFNIEDKKTARIESFSIVITLDVAAD